MFGEPLVGAAERYVPYEINVSSVHHSQTLPSSQSFRCQTSFGADLIAAGPCRASTIGVSGKQRHEHVIRAVKPAINRFFCALLYF